MGPFDVESDSQPANTRVATICRSLSDVCSALDNRSTAVTWLSVEQAQLNLSGSHILAGNRIFDLNRLADRHPARGPPRVEC